MSIERSKGFPWDSIVASAITALLVIAAWVYSSGRTNAEETARIVALELRVDILERQTANGLQTLADGQQQTYRRMDVMEAQQALLHKRVNGQ